MPGAEDFLNDGMRAERLGALDRALVAYQAAIDTMADPAGKAEAYTRLADVHREQCHWDEAIAAARQGQQLARAAGLERHLADAMIAEANVLMIRGDFGQAMPRFEELARISSDPRVRGIALQNTASMLAQQGRFDAAERAFRESLGNFQKAGYVRGQAIAWNNLGRLALDRKDYAAAGPLLERAIEQAGAVEDAELSALASQNLAIALCETGEVDRALDMGSAALGFFTMCGNRFREIECLRLIGSIQEKLGAIDASRRCYERALRVATEIESVVEMRVTRERLDLLNSR